MANLIKDLEYLLNKNITPSLFPVKKGNVISIDKYKCIPTKIGFKVVDTSNKTIVAETFTKTAALAIAKNISAKKNSTKRILELDKVIEKHYNDCVFYKHTLEKSQDQQKIQATQTRYDISRNITRHAKARLDNFLLR